MTKMYEFPGLNYSDGALSERQSYVPTVERETRQVVVDQIRGEQPSTVLGLLIARREAMTPELIAGILGKDIDEVEWTADVLEADRLCVRVSVDGISRIVAYDAQDVA